MALDSTGEAATVRFPKPPITRLSTPHYDVGRAGHPVIGICYHIAAGSRAGVVEWFANPASKVSSHCLICRDGTILQFVDLGDTAWTQGVVNKPTWPLIKQYPAPNRSLIGIEHEGQTGDPWTEEMYAADLALTLYLCERFGIKPERPYLLGHNELDSVNRPQCPGQTFPWTRLLGDLRTIYTPEAPPGLSLPRLVRPVPITCDDRLLGQQYVAMGWADSDGMVWAPVRAAVEAVDGVVMALPPDGPVQKVNLRVRPTP